LESDGGSVELYPAMPPGGGLFNFVLPSIALDSLLCTAVLDGRASQCASGNLGLVFQAGYLLRDLLIGAVDPGKRAETIRWTFTLSAMPTARAVDR
jgi:hypothetical protein